MTADLSGRDLAWLERRRAELLALFAQVGDFRRGALNPVWRKCGKPDCACAQKGHRGHGPQWNLTRRVNGKTVNVHLKPGPELEKARRAALLQAVLDEQDDGYCGPHAGCGCSGQAVYAGSRPKTITTVLGPVALQRAWYHCAACKRGFAPRDRQMDLLPGGGLPGSGPPGAGLHRLRPGGGLPFRR